MYTFKNRLRLSRDAILALCIIALAFVVRLILIAHGWPNTTSEEGTFGLEAMHIAYRGEFPIFMYGQHYMGTLEAYFGALFFHIFGTSLFSLRLGMLTLFTLFLFCLYSLTKLLYSPRMALFTLLILSFGSQGILQPEMMVLGGTTETLVFGTLLLLLATRLALSSGQKRTPRDRWVRLLEFAAWGCCAGLGLWSHLLVAPFILVSGLLLLLFCYKELLTLAPVALLLGLIIGSIPLILYNLKAPASQNSIATFLSIYNIGHPVVADPSFPLKQLSGTFLFSLPTATGMNTLCDVRAMPFFSATPAPAICVLTQGGWSLAYLLLMATAFCLAGWGLFTLSKFYKGRTSNWSVEERPMAVIYTAQLMLLLSAVLTLFLFAHSPNSASRPWSTRYLVGLMIATPALLWPLWNGLATTIKAGFPVLTRARLFTIARWAVLALLLGLFVGETLFTTNDMPAIQKDSTQANTVTQKLVQMGAVHIYSGYWQCDRFIFLTQEKIICAVLEENLSRGLTRYRPYYDSVHADTHASYVFPQGSNYEKNFERKMAESGLQFQKIVVAGYVVFRPLR